MRSRLVNCKSSLLPFLYAELRRLLSRTSSAPRLPSNRSPNYILVTSILHALWRKHQLQLRHQARDRPFAPPQQLPCPLPRSRHRLLLLPHLRTRSLRSLTRPFRTVFSRGTILVERATKQKRNTRLWCMHMVAGMCYNVGQQ